MFRTEDKYCAEELGQVTHDYLNLVFVDGDTRSAEQWDTQKTRACSFSEWSITWGPGGLPNIFSEGLVYKTNQLDGESDPYYIGDFTFYPENWGDKVIYEHPGYYPPNDVYEKDFYGVFILTESTVAASFSADCPTGTASDCEAIWYLHIWVVDSTHGCTPDRDSEIAFSGDYNYYYAT